VLPARSAGGPVENTSRNWRPAAAALAVLVILIVAAALAVSYRAKIIAGAHDASAAAARMYRSHVQSDGAPAAKPSAQAISTPRGSAAAAPGISATTAASSAPLVLKLEAGKAANVKIVADGRVVFDGAVRVNDVKQFEAHETFDVSCSDSSAVLLELNGQTVPPIGTPGQPGAITLTRGDAGLSSGGSH
ncbi:MAG: DUF4115 domain-containing protein, partial [Acidobacteriota bacterium]|nr:DUF4115 domain-containing protein [Acidobacteriota bacterium]